MLKLSKSTPPFCIIKKQMEMVTNHWVLKCLILKGPVLVSFLIYSLPQ